MLHIIVFQNKIFGVLNTVSDSRSLNRGEHKITHIVKYTAIFIPFCRWASWRKCIAHCPTFNYYQLLIVGYSVRVYTISLEKIILILKKKKKKKQINDIMVKMKCRKCRNKINSDSSDEEED